MAHIILFIILAPIGVALLVMLGILIVTGVREGHFKDAIAAIRQQIAR